MTQPSNWEEEIKYLRERISKMLKEQADTIVMKEIENILGRVKIITHRDLSNPGRYDWFVEQRVDK